MSTTYVYPVTPELVEQSAVPPPPALPPPPDPTTTQQLMNAAILSAQQQAILASNPSTGLTPVPPPTTQPQPFDYYTVASQPPYNPYYDYAAQLLAQGDTQTPEGQQLQALVNQMVGVAQPVDPLQFGGYSLVPKGRMLQQQGALAALGAPAQLLQQQFLEQQERNLKRQLIGAQLAAQAGMHWFDTVLKGWIADLDAQTRMWLAEYTASIDQSNLDAQLKTQLKIALLEDAMRRYLADKTVQAAKSGQPKTWQSVLGALPGITGFLDKSGLLDWFSEWLMPTTTASAVAAASAPAVAGMDAGIGLLFS